MTTMVPRTLVCSSGVDRWLHLGLTGWHLWKASFALDICRVLKQQKTSEIRFTYSLSLWNMRNYHVFKDGLVRSSQWDPAKIIRLSHGAWWRAWLPSSPECVCCLLCAQWQVQRGVGTERRETSERSHPSILFQSNSLGISNFEDFELSSFSIFQLRKLSFPHLSSLHQAMAWARHCGCSTGTLAGMPSDTKGYHLRRLSVTFTGLLVYPPKGTPFATWDIWDSWDSCILMKLVLWFSDCFWLFLMFCMAILPCFVWLPGVGKITNVWQGFFENRRFWNPSCSQWGRRGWLAPHAQQRIEAHCIQMSPKRILQRLKRLKIKRDNQKQFVWRKMRTLGPFNFHFGVNNIQYIHARHWMQTKPDQTWVGKCIQFVTQCLFHSPHRQHGNCAQDEPSDGWLHVDNWASCWESWSPNWKPPLGRLTRGKLNITRNSLDHYFKWLWIWTRRLWKLCQTCFKQPHVAWEEGKRGCGSC